MPFAWQPNLPIIFFLNTSSISAVVKLPIIFLFSIKLKNCTAAKNDFRHCNIKMFVPGYLFPWHRLLRRTIQRSGNCSARLRTYKSATQRKLHIYSVAWLKKIFLMIVSKEHEEH